MGLWSDILNSFRRNAPDREHQCHFETDVPVKMNCNNRSFRQKITFKTGSARPVDFRSPTLPPVSVSISSATFSDATSLTFQPNDIVVFVGPNNSGKSVALKDIRNSAKESNIYNLVVKKIQLHTSGTSKEVYDWIKSIARPSTFGFSMLNGTVDLERIEVLWSNRHKNGLGQLTDFFCDLSQQSID